MTVTVSASGSSTPAAGPGTTTDEAEAEALAAGERIGDETIGTSAVSVVCPTSVCRLVKIFVAVTVGVGGDCVMVTEIVFSDSVDSVTVWTIVVGWAENVWPPSTLTTEYVAGRGSARTVLTRPAVTMMVDDREYRIATLYQLLAGSVRGDGM